MEAKKIVIICNGFWPENNPRAFRATELAKELSRKSNYVLVLKPNVTKDQKAYAEAYGFKMESIGDFKRYSFFKVNGSLSNFIKRFFTRFTQLFFEYPDIKLGFLVNSAVKKSKESFDLCISIAVPYPIHWGTAAGLSKNKFAKKWIADCGDPFMGDESDSFKHPFYFKYVEKWFCRKVDYLSVPTENSYKGYYPEFRKKIVVIPQGFKFEDIELANNKHEFNCPAFGYAGSVIPNYREPDEFLNYLANFQQDFRFIIYTTNPLYFEKFKQKLGDKLLIFSNSDRINVLYEFSKLDFVVNFNNKGTKQTASKLIDYHIINKPILNIEFRMFNRDHFKEFYNGDFTNRFIIDNPDQYKIEKVASRFLELVK